MTIKIDFFEICTGSTVLITILVIYIVNKFLLKNEPKLRIDISILGIFASIIVSICVMGYNSKIVKQNPLIVFIIIVSIISLSIIILCMYILLINKKSLNTISDNLKQQNSINSQGNILFFPTKEKSFSNLIDITKTAKEKIIVTRFSSFDISMETEYWKEIKDKALDPEVLSIRIHCLAHKSLNCIDNVCKLINDFNNAKRFYLGITFSNNEFDMIIVDEKECMICFHDINTAIKNGFRVNANLLGSTEILSNFNTTIHRIYNNCYIIIDFEKFLNSDEKILKLTEFLKNLHKEFCGGTLPKNIPNEDMEDFLEKILI